MKSKVLVACPVWDQDSYIIDKFIETYKGYDMLFIDNTIGSTDFYEYLLSKGVNAMRHDWNPEQTYQLDMLGDCDNKIIDYILKHDYTHWLWTAPDIVPPENAIERLLAHKKDIVGFTANMYADNGPPALFKDGVLPWKDGKFSLNIYSWDDINNAQRKLIKVHGIGGVTLYSRKVLEQCRFNHPIDTIWGEELWWFSEVAEKGFIHWCDTSDRAFNKTGKNKIGIIKSHLYFLMYALKWAERHPSSSLDRFILRCHK